MAVIISSISSTNLINIVVIIFRCALLYFILLFTCCSLVSRYFIASVYTYVCAILRYKLWSLIVSPFPHHYYYFLHTHTHTHLSITFVTPPSICCVLSLLFSIGFGCLFISTLPILSPSPIPLNSYRMPARRIDTTKQQATVGSQQGKHYMFHLSRKVLEFHNVHGFQRHEVVVMHRHVGGAILQG